MRHSRFQDIEAIALIMFIMGFPLLLISFIYNVSDLHNFTEKNQVLICMILYFIFFIAEIRIGKEVGL